MSASSKIEWTDATWNPVTGCDHVSPGCDNCYAEAIAKRFHRPFIGAVECHADRLEMPLRWRKPRRVFVNSVSDLFHPDVPDSFIAKVFTVMARAEAHTFQVLTKRPQRMAAFLKALTSPRPDVWPLPNVWLGVSVENQRYADLRIPHLLATPAAVRFISAEPLLGPIGLSLEWVPGLVNSRRDYGALDWVIVGGESGHGARPMEVAWARHLRDQCVATHVPFFFKQWGEWGVVGWKVDPMINRENPKMTHMGKKNAGRELDGRTWDEYPA